MSIGSGVTNGIAGLQGGLAFKDMTYGVSEQGANTYLDGINRFAINNAIKAVQNGAFKVKTELEKG